MNNQDICFIIIVVSLLIISILSLQFMKSREKKMEKIDKAQKDMLDLEAITKNIESDYKPINIELTSYEKEQENNAIISYEELLSNKNSHRINYDEAFKTDSGISVKKVDLRENFEKSTVRETKIEVSLMSYEKEEAFLKALKQLQSDLAR